MLCMVCVCVCVWAVCVCMLYMGCVCVCVHVVYGLCVRVCACVYGLCVRVCACVYGLCVCVRVCACCVWAVCVCMLCMGYVCMCSCVYGHVCAFVYMGHVCICVCVCTGRVCPPALDVDVPLAVSTSVCVNAGLGRQTGDPADQQQRCLSHLLRSPSRAVDWSQQPCKTALQRPRPQSLRLSPAVCQGQCVSGAGWSPPRVVAAVPPMSLLTPPACPLEWCSGPRDRLHSCPWH